MTILASQALARHTRFAGRYRLGRRLGAGSQGEVFLAREMATGRDRTVKVIRRASDRDMTRRFLREARLLASIRHENVVAVVDAGEADGYRYLVTEYVGGGSLAARLSTRRAPSCAETIRILIDVLDALDACHARGIVHRDLKPANVLLTLAGRARLIDFGFARDLDASRTRLTGSGIVIGTPGYMAPEQMCGDPAGPAADVFAAGAILYEMLSGRSPFPHRSLLSLVRRLQREAPRPLVPRVPGVSPRLIAIVRRALARDPSRRFRGAAHMADALRQERARLAVRPPGAPRRRAPGRLRAGVFALLAFVMLLVVCARGRVAGPAARAGGGGATGEIESTTRPERPGHG